MKWAVACGVWLTALPSVAATDKPRVCLLEVLDSSNQLPIAKTIGTLEGELRKVFVVVPHKRVARAAKLDRLQRSKWFEPRELSKLSKRLSFELALSARVTSVFGTWTLYLTAYDARTGDIWGESHRILSRPRLAEDQARELILALREELTKRSNPPVEEPPKVEEPPEVTTPAAPDVWEEATDGFSAPAAESGLLETIRAETKLEVGGRDGFEHYAFFTNAEADKISGRDNIDAAIRVKVVHPGATAYASVLARYDFADTTRNRFEPEEAWVELNFPGVTVKAGRFIAAWGSASLYNPSDVLNPIDQRDPLDPEKWGTLMLKLSTTLGPATFEAYYLPVPEMHRLPLITGISTDGRLESRSRWIRASVDVDTVAPVTFSVSPMQPPSPRPSNTQFAARALVSVAGADVSLGYASLVDRYPSPLLEAVPTAGVPLETTIHVDWLFRRLHVITLDVERTFGKLRVAAEAAAFLTRDLEALNRNVADPYLIVNAGADYQTASFLGDQRLHFFLEFVTAQPLAGKLATEGTDLWRYPFTLSLIGRVSWEFNEDLRFDLNAISSLRRLDAMLSPRLEYSFFDRVKAQVGVDVLLGDPANGFFGPYQDNSRFIAVVESRF